MGVLKVRVGGAWQQLGMAGGPLPPGGVLGDILVKQSATLSDATWGYTMPKLVIGDNSLYNETLSVAASTHATSERATLKLGDWQVMQDYVANGVKDFAIWGPAGGGRALTIAATGKRIEIGADTTGIVIQLGHINDARVIIGNDAGFRDVGQPHTVSVISESDASRGTLRFGASTAEIAGVGNYLHLHAPVLMYFDADTHYFRTTAGADKGVIDGSSNMTMNGSITASTLYSGGQVYCGAAQWFRVRGSGSGIHWEDFGGGWYMNDVTWMRIYGSKWVDAFGYALSWQGQIRLYAAGDGTHTLGYSNEAAAAIDPGSGIASNGPKLQGNSTVWLRTAGDGRSFLFASGNSYLPSAGVYSKFSSRELKEDITPLDPDACLAEVARWEPVDYVVIDSPEKGRRDGFIAEDMNDVSPQLVVRTPADSERPNRPHAIDYGAFTPRLTGAVQALLRRIEQLEGKSV